MSKSLNLRWFAPEDAAGGLAFSGSPAALSPVRVMRFRGFWDSVRGCLGNMKTNHDKEMTGSIQTIGNRARGWAIATAGLVTLSLAALTGCQSVQGNSPVTMVRVIDASYNAPTVNVDVGTTTIAANIGEATITNYGFLAPEPSTAYIYPATSRTPTASAIGQFQASQQYSVYLTDSGAGYAATILTDQATAPPAGDIAVRFLQQALATGSVDIYFIPSGDTLADARPVVSNLAVKSIKSYINFPAGTYSVVVTPAGATKASYTGTSIQFSAGQVRTMLIMDAQLTTNPPVNVVIGDDLN